MKNLYTTKFVEMKIKNETKIEVFAENEYYEMVKIASFDFYYNEGSYIALNGSNKEVKRFSTIMNYLIKQNENLFWNSTELELVKLNVKNIKAKEYKESKEDAVAKSNNKADEFMKNILNAEERHINICKSCENKTDDELMVLIKNTFKHASKNVLKKVFELIRRYDTMINPTTTVEAVKAVEVSPEVIKTEVSTEAVEVSPEVYINNSTNGSYIPATFSVKASSDNKYIYISNEDCHIYNVLTVFNPNMELKPITGELEVIYQTKYVVMNLLKAMSAKYNFTKRFDDYDFDNLKSKLDVCKTLSLEVNQLILALEVHMNDGNMLEARDTFLKLKYELDYIIPKLDNHGLYFMKKII